MELIDKAALVAEIEKRKNSNREICTAEGSGAYYEDGFILDIINSLEVKEVDLEKEFEDFVVDDPVIGNLVNFNAAKIIAKHFFKLGLKAKGK